MRTSGATRQKNWRTQSNISGYTGPIFTIFSPYSEQFRVCFITICYGGNIALLGGIYARLCHAFLSSYLLTGRRYRDRNFYVAMRPVPIHVNNLVIITSLPGWAKYCDDYICLFARIFRYRHNRTSPNFMHVFSARGMYA